MIVKHVLRQTDSSVFDLLDCVMNKVMFTSVKYHRTNPITLVITGL